MELIKGNEYMVEKCGKVAKAIYVCLGTSGEGTVESHMFMFKRKIKCSDGRSYKYAFVDPSEISERVH